MTARAEELARNGDVVVYRKTGMSRAEFQRDHLAACVPVVIADATRDWPARQRFTPEFFRRHYGERIVRIDNDPRSWTLAEFIDLLERSTQQNPAPYPCKLQLDDYPELLPDVSPRYVFAQPDRSHSRLLPQRFVAGASKLEIFFGSPGGQFPYMHYDYMGLHAYINQLYGDKEFTAIPPDQTGYVYPNPDDPWRSLVDNYHQPDLARFPLFAKATPVTFTVKAGETLFIPNGWWHSARSLTVSISVALDQLEASNWGRFSAEVAHMLRNSGAAKRSAAAAYFGAAGPAFTAMEKLGLRR